ncbi:MAG: hypothetical protein CMP23_16675 [Rickettsiales bacterium]|nr:hypothetical protein [Rickettsiales bacterium]
MPIQVSLVVLLWVFSPITATLRAFFELPRFELDLVRGTLALLAILLLLRREFVRGGLSELVRSFLLELPRRAPLFSSVLALFVVSLASSSRPLLTAWRLVGLATMVALGVYLARRLDTDQLCRLLLRALVPLLLASVLVALLVPEFGQHLNRPRAAIDGAWRGVLGHRNGLGPAATITVLAAVALLPGTARDSWSRPPIAVLWAMLGLFVLYQSGSFTALAMVVVGLLVLALGRVGGGRPRLQVAGLAVFGGLVVVALLHHESFFALFGRDSTLSGRTILWKKSLEFIELRPLVGHGYGLSWPEVPALASQLEVLDRPWQRSFHSGYLAAAFWAGWPALVLLMVALLRALVALGRRWLAGGTVLAPAFPLALLAALLVLAVSETRLLLHAHFFTALLCAMVLRAQGMNPTMMSSQDSTDFTQGAGDGNG